MNDLLKMAKSHTVKNIVKNRKSKKGSNDYIVEIMADGKPIERIDLVVMITIKRLEDHAEPVSQKELTEGFKNEDPEIIERYTKMYTTSKNGVDTSVARGQQKSNFCNSDYSTEYDLVKQGSKLKLVKLTK